MSVTCRLIEYDPNVKPLVGEMWYVPYYLTPPWDKELSQSYLDDWADKRPPLMVMLPDGTRFPLDARSTTAREAGTRAGWRITGEPPALTAQPSIHIQDGPTPDGRMIDRWHGYLTNGELVG